MDLADTGFADTDFANTDFANRDFANRDLANTKDQSLLRFYENVRDQVQADRRSGGKYRFAGDGVRQYADVLRQEIDRRRLRFTPIDW
jgi:hypothetical protein